jgi:plastocyanin
MSYLRIGALALLLTTVFCATVSVTTSGLTFVPATVNVNVGDTVLWTGISAHTVTQTDTSTSTTATSGGWKSSGGDTYSKTFDVATVGTATAFYYICDFHIGSGMRGQINVVATTTTATPTPTATGTTVAPSNTTTASPTTSAPTNTTSAPTTTAIPATTSTPATTSSPVTTGGPTSTPKPSSASTHAFFAAIIISLIAILA